MLNRNDHARALRLIRAIAAGGASPSTALPHILRICDQALGTAATPSHPTPARPRAAAPERWVERDVEPEPCYG